MGVVRNTKSVTLILKAFGTSKQALSVVELVKMFEGKMNKTTVYRILERLEDEGKLHSFTGKDGLKWVAKCDGCISTNHVDDHPHFQCSKCGSSQCLPLDIAIPLGTKHKIESANFLFIGQCEDCLKTYSKKSK